MTLTFTPQLLSRLPRIFTTPNQSPFTMTPELQALVYDILPSFGGRCRKAMLGVCITPSAVPLPCHPTVPWPPNESPAQPFSRVVLSETDSQSVNAGFDPAVTLGFFSVPTDFSLSHPARFRPRPHSVLPGRQSRGHICLPVPLFWPHD